MQKVLCTTLLASGIASADLLTIEVDGIADPAFGSFSGELYLDTVTGSLTGQTLLSDIGASIDFNGTYGGEGTSGETSQGSVSGPSYQGVSTITIPFVGSLDWAFDVVFGSGVSLGDAGLGVVNLQGINPLSDPPGPLDANLSFNYSVVPAPGAIAMLGLVGLGRRRRS
jgi:hypothetical protein